MNYQFGEEPARSERIFSQLTTAWYNWSVSETLHRRHVHCWALTAAYYSMIHAVRTLICLTSYHREEFIKNHSLFLSFLSGSCQSKKEKEMAPKREKAIEELSVYLGMSNSEIDKLFREFFRVLKVLKIARNMSSYEKYVIAHQLRSDIEASSWIVEICESSLVCVEKINEKIAELVLRYICNHRLSSYYLHHLDEELTQFEKLIEGECLIMPEGLGSLICRFSGYITPERKPEGIELFLQLTRRYRSKDKQYKKLHDIWQETRNLCRK